MVAAMGVLKYHPETLAPAFADAAQRSARLVAFSLMNTLHDNTHTHAAVTNPIERRMHALMVAGMEGDAAAYHTFLLELTAHLRAFVRRRL